MSDDIYDPIKPTTSTGKKLATPPGFMVTCLACGRRLVTTQEANAGLKGVACDMCNYPLYPIPP